MTLLGWVIRFAASNWYTGRDDYYDRFVGKETPQDNWHKRRR
jgi:hypothetical protein